jgi:hypothetical protein
MLDLTDVQEDGRSIFDVFGSCIEWPCLKVLRLEALLNVNDRTCRSLVCMSGLPDGAQDLCLVSSPHKSSSFSRYCTMRLCEALSQWTRLEVLELGSFVLPPDCEGDLCNTLAGLPLFKCVS